MGESRWFLVVSSACMSTSYKNSPPTYHFSESPKRVWGHCTGSLVQIVCYIPAWPRAINCLVHWSSPVHKLVFSQQYGPVRKLVATKKPITSERRVAIRDKNYIRISYLTTYRTYYLTILFFQCLYVLQYFYQRTVIHLPV